MRGKGKEEDLVNKELNSENWCFVCKDGGALRICDYKQCLKSYHHFCLEKDESFLESEKKWNCAWHRCFRCRRSSHLHCYTCTNSVCRYCLSTEEILQVKGQYGFCKPCLKLALLIEEKRTYDSDGGTVDFADRETFEGLHMEYYMILKKDQGFELADIYAAKERLKGKKGHETKSGSEDFDDFDEEEEEPISDYDDLEVQKKKRRRSRNRSNGRNSATQTSGKSNKKEFVGWASRALVEFLGSIGKRTDEKLSQHDVTSIVNEYIKERKLLHPANKGIVTCDAQLHSLFRKKTINKLRVHDLLKDHFAKNREETEKYNVGLDLEEENLDTLNPCKRKREMGVEKESLKKDDVENNVPLKSRFASIVVENLKLVCLGRGVLKEMLKEAETFEEKVTGCFVRVKSDPRNRRSNSHHLVQVKGVKAVSIDETNTETVLLLSAMPNEIRIPLVSDENITKEECEDLRKKMLAGEIERPTVDYLQQKVNDVHKDMTNLSIRKELKLLQHYIEFANEKGWRHEMFEHLERKKTLQSPMECSRLLGNVPTVIADVYDPERDPEGAKNDIKSVEASSESKPPCSSPMFSDGQQEEENSCDGQTSFSVNDQNIPKKSVSNEPRRAPAPESESEHVKAKGCDDSKIEVIDIPSDEDVADDSKAAHRFPANHDDERENETWCMRGPEGERHTSVPLCVLRRWYESCPDTASEFKVWREGGCEEDAIPVPESLKK